MGPIDALAKVAMVAIGVVVFEPNILVLVIKARRPLLARFVANDGNASLARRTFLHTNYRGKVSLGVVR